MPPSFSEDADPPALQLLKMVASKAAGETPTGGVPVSPARPSLLTQRFSDGVRRGLWRTENDAWEPARLSAPGLGG